MDWCWYQTQLTTGGWQNFQLELVQVSQYYLPHFVSETNNTHELLDIADISFVVYYDFLQGKTEQQFCYSNPSTFMDFYLGYDMLGKLMSFLLLNFLISK